MPKMVTIELDPGYTPKAADKAAFEAAKAKGSLSVSWVAAQEAVANSGGMYRIRPDAAPALPSAPPLSSLPSEELKRMFVSMGGKVPTGKQMKRQEIIAWIEKQMDGFEILDDDGDE